MERLVYVLDVSMILNFAPTRWAMEWDYRAWSWVRLQ